MQQQSTDHLNSLGAELITRTNFLELLQTSLQNESLQGKWTNLS